MDSGMMYLGTCDCGARHYGEPVDEETGYETWACSVCGARLCDGCTQFRCGGCRQWFCSDCAKRVGDVWFCPACSNEQATTEIKACAVVEKQAAALAWSIDQALRRTA